MSEFFSVSFFLKKDVQQSKKFLFTDSKSRILGRWERNCPHSLNSLVQVPARLISPSKLCFFLPYEIFVCLRKTIWCHVYFPVDISPFSLWVKHAYAITLLLTVTRIFPLKQSWLVISKCRWTFSSNENASPKWNWIFRLPVTRIPHVILKLSQRSV